MTRLPIYPRLAESRVEDALADTPVVLIHGPRQSGKTTLARMVGEPRKYTYISFDDDVALASAKADPVGFASETCRNGPLSTRSSARRGSSPLSRSR